MQDRTPLSVAGTGIILIVIGLAVKALVPRLVEVGSFVVTIGWAALIIAALLFVIELVQKNTH